MSTLECLRASWPAKGLKEMKPRAAALRNEGHLFPGKQSLHVTGTFAQAVFSLDNLILLTRRWKLLKVFFFILFLFFPARSNGWQRFFYAFLRSRTLALRVPTSPLEPPAPASLAPWPGVRRQSIARSAVHTIWCGDASASLRRPRGRGLPCKRGPSSREAHGRRNPECSTGG